MNMARTKTYPHEIGRERFEQIRPILESARKTTRPRTVDLYEVFCGVGYVLKTGCQWRMLPKDFPKWQTCYAYWQKWTEPRADGPTLLEASLKKCGWRGPRAPFETRGTVAADR